MNRNQIRDPLKGFLYSLFVIAMGFLLTGCLKVKTRNNGSWELFFGTQVGVRTGSAKTSQNPADDGTAVAEMELPSFEEWLLRDRTKATPASGVTVETVDATNPVTLPDGTRAHAPPN